MRVNPAQGVRLLHGVASGAEEDYKGFALYGILDSLRTEKGGETGHVRAVMERCGKAHLKKKPPSLCLLQKGAQRRVGSCFLQFFGVPVFGLALLH